MKNRAINSLYALEFKLQKKSIIWWLAVLAVLLIVEVAIYPLMEKIYGLVSEEMLKDMVDSGVPIEFENVTQYFLMSCSDLISIGGALFVACYAMSSLTRDFKNKSSEMLYTNAVSRSDIALTKYASVLTMIAVFNVGMLIIELIAMCAVDIQGIEIVPLLAVFMYNIVLHIIIVSIVFGICLMRNKAGFGIALGVTLILYFIATIAMPLDGGWKFLEYLTPFTPLYGIDMYAPFNINFYPFLIFGAVALVLMFFGLYKFKKSDM